MAEFRYVDPEGETVIIPLDGIALRITHGETLIAYKPLPVLLNQVAGTLATEDSYSVIVVNDKSGEDFAAPTSVDFVREDARR